MDIGSIAKTAFTVASFTNPAFAFANFGRQLLSTVGQEVIQNLGSEMGLSQSVIDMAQGSFAASVGDARGVLQNVQETRQSMVNDFLSGMNASPLQQGQFMNDVQNLVRDLIEMGRKEAQEGNGEGEESAGGESFLVAFAKALGKTMDSKMDRMMDISKKIDKEIQGANDSGGKKQAVISELSAELQGLSQEVNILSQALTNSVKSVGEASSTLARKS